jgi:competence protein ComEC
LFRPLLFLAAGILICDADAGRQQHISWLAGLAVIAGFCVLMLAWQRSYHRSTQLLFLLAIAIFFGTSGYCLYAWSDAGAAEDANDADGKSALSLIRLKAEPQQRPRTMKLLVQRLANIHGQTVQPVSGDALVYVYRNPNLPAFAEGDTLLLPARWQAIHNSGNPFELDNARLQRRRGIRVQQFLPAEQLSIFGRAAPRSRGWLREAQQWCRHRLCDYIADSAALGLLQAMLTGDESGFDPELRQAYAQTGVIHIVSISGSHVAVLWLLVAGLLFWLKGPRGLWVKSIAGIVLVWLYVLIAGGPPSALRAALMFTVLVLSTLSTREPQPLNTLCAAAFVLIAWQPAWLFSVGFQLSFGAVLGMMVFYAPILRLWAWPRTFWLTQKLWQALAASFSAELLTAPLVVYYFHNFPLLFLPANILAMALAGFCALAGGLAIIAFAWLPVAAQAIGHGVSFLIGLFNAGVAWMQHLNIEALQHLRITVPELLLLYALIAAVGAWWLNGWRKGATASLLVCCLLMTSLNLHHLSALRQERLLVLSAGREPAVALMRGTHHQALAGSTESFAAQAALNGYAAWKPQRASTADCIVVKGKRVLMLRDTVLAPGTSRFPVDVVIVEKPARGLDAAAVLNRFVPHEVVLAGKASQKSRLQWQAQCAAQNVQLHEPANEGAWVLE